MGLRPFIDRWRLIPRLVDEIFRCLAVAACAARRHPACRDAGRNCGSRNDRLAGDGPPSSWPWGARLEEPLTA